MQAQATSFFWAFALLVSGCVSDPDAFASDAADASVDAELTPDAAVGDAEPVPDALVTIPVGCGDGFVDGDEACDDGNEISGDGCENDCTWSCTADEECETADLCRLFRCRSDHTCLPPSRARNGTGCDADMDVATRDVCLEGACVPSVCGDGLVDGVAGEDCDDGNAIAGDGCEADCTYSCTADAECETGDPCVRSYCAASHACTVPSTASGTACDADADPTTRDVCGPSGCQASVCGDGVVDSSAGEICDDGNAVTGDGCEADCTYSCTSNAECDDGDPCDGSEYCSSSTHTCMHPGVFGLC